MQPDKCLGKTQSHPIMSSDTAKEVSSCLEGCAARTEPAGEGAAGREDGAADREPADRDSESDGGRRAASPRSREDSSQVVADGASLSLKLDSQPGMALRIQLQGRHGEEGERRWHLWTLVLSDENPDALRIQGNPTNCILIDEAENASVEVDCGRVANETILFCYKGGRSDAELRPGGCRWCLHEDGTVQHPGSDFVWGFSNGWFYDCNGTNHRQVNPWPLVLVPKGDPRQVRLTQLRTAPFEPAEQQFGNASNEPAQSFGDAGSLVLLSESDTCKAMGWQAEASNHSMQFSGQDRVMRKRFFKFNARSGEFAILRAHGPRDCCVLEHDGLFMCSDCCRDTAGNPVILLNEVKGPIPRFSVETMDHRKGEWWWYFCLKPDGTIALYQHEHMVLGYATTPTYSELVLVRRGSPNCLIFKNHTR
eukprot:TRINITY_DN5633_c0_g1_i1.p1 TRINITY_DN5633_c0_g1~~TRINITY_DN5633_c0_g1_i1.p1  ORF type:complete len:423 (+),score=42.45 TRINITY_DN5633_c0_g1_i1:44-1312(+)